MIKIILNVGACLGWQPRMVYLLVLALPGLGLGCATSFKYTPRPDPAYPASARQTGLAIQTGEDDRPPEAREPDWTEDAETMVAHALAVEVKHARLFQRVQLHAGEVNPQKYSRTVHFRVLQFECSDQADVLAKTGQDVLRRQVPGFRGAWIAKSIPTQFEVAVEIEFAVFDEASRSPVFQKTYSASRTLTINGYQGESPKIQQTSAALAEVLAEFIADLTRLPANAPAS